jgi:nicotinamidase-related amidase
MVEPKEFAMTTAASDQEVLVLIDIQNDYFPGGAHEVPGSTAAALRAADLLAAFRAGRGPVVHVQHVATRPGSTFFLPDTPGCGIHPSVQPRPGEPVVVKHFPNGFRATGLQETLVRLGAGRLVLAGMMTHMCVDATTRAAFDLGYDCTVAGDACAAPAQAWGGAEVPAAQVHAAFLAALAGTYARVLPTAEVLK